MTSKQEAASLMISRVVPVGTLLTLLVTAVGGAAFVTDLDTTLGGAVKDLSDIKIEVKQMNMQMATQANGITALQERDESRLRRLERIESDIGELRERVRAVELKVRDH